MESHISDRCSYCTSQDTVRKAVEYNLNIALSFEIIVNGGKVIVFDVITGLHVMSG